MTKVTISDSSITEDFIHSLINALQLCISSRISNYFFNRETGEITIEIFRPRKKKDIGWEYFCKLNDQAGDLQEVTISNYILKETNLTNFLLLTRLNEENMRALAQRDKQYLPFIHKIFGDVGIKEKNFLSNTEQVAAYIFDQVAKKKMTLRELAEKSGLTQTAVSNFKAGNDIRLSSLLKILKSLKLNLTIED